MTGENSSVWESGGPHRDCSTSLSRRSSLRQLAFTRLASDHACLTHARLFPPCSQIGGRTTPDKMGKWWRRRSPSRPPPPLVAAITSTRLCRSSTEWNSIGGRRRRGARHTTRPHHSPSHQPYARRALMEHSCRKVQNYEVPRRRRRRRRLPKDGRGEEIAK